MNDDRFGHASETLDSIWDWYTSTFVYTDVATPLGDWFISEEGTDQWVPEVFKLPGVISAEIAGTVPIIGIPIEYTIKTANNMLVEVVIWPRIDRFYGPGEFDGQLVSAKIMTDFGVVDIDFPINTVIEGGRVRTPGIKRSSYEKLTEWA